MTDLSYAIELLENYVSANFRYRHSSWPMASKWYQLPEGHEPVARVRSYIAALRILRREAPAVVIDVPGCTCSERTQEQLDRADVCPACVSYFDLDRWHPEQP